LEAMGLNKKIGMILAVFFILVISATVTAEIKPWDFLKPVSETVNEFNQIIKFGVFFLSIGLMIIALRAYKKTKTQRFFFIALAFSLFAIKWGIKIADLFLSPGNFFNNSSESFVELLILASLFIAIFRK
jgi:hypothetical protein